MAISDVKKRQFLDLLELLGSDPKRKLDSTFGDSIRGLFKLKKIREALRKKKKIYDTAYVNTFIKYGIKYPDNIYEKLDDIWNNGIKNITGDNIYALQRILDIDNKLDKIYKKTIGVFTWIYVRIIRSDRYISHINKVWKKYKMETLMFAEELLKEQ